LHSSTEKIVETLAAPIHAASELLRTSPSIGISLYPGDGQDPISCSSYVPDQRVGRNSYRFYRDPELLARNVKPVRERA
jgi:hypothetical protein